jgi:PKD repeat protein
LGTVELLSSTSAGAAVRTRQLDRLRLDDSANARLCFTPEAFGSYDITITVSDECGAEATETITVTVTDKGHVVITCPTEPAVLCAAGEHCLPLAVEGQEFEVSTSMGVWSDGQLCLTVSEPGTYAVTVIAAAACNSDTCIVTVTYIEPVEIACGVTDTTLFMCQAEPMTVVVPVTVTGQDATITVTPETATYADGMVSVPVSGEGAIQVTVFAVNACGEAVCSFEVNTVVNRPPVVTIGPDTTITLCELTELCIAYSAVDDDDNLKEIRTSLGVVNDGHVCFTPAAFGEYTLIVTATDSCGAADADTIRVTVLEGAFAAIDCPLTTISKFISVPDSVYAPIAITPAEAVVTVLPHGSYNMATGEFSAYLEATGLHTFTLIAAAECNVDTCTFSIDIQQYVPPIVDCISTLDTALCLIRPDTLCVPVTIVGSEVQVLVSAPAYYTDGSVCLPVTAPGEYVVDITAFNDRDTATCTSTLVVTGGTPPILEMPAELTMNLCEPGQACFDVLIDDTDFDIAQISVSRGQYNLETGQICFNAAVSGDYAIVVTVRDECDNRVTDTTVVTVIINEAPIVTLPDDYLLFVCELSEVCVDAQVADNGPVSGRRPLASTMPRPARSASRRRVPGGIPSYSQPSMTAISRVADTVTIDLSVNSAPMVNGLVDTTVYLCYPTEICLPVNIVDVDDNIASITVNRGSLKNGRVCFVPYSAGTFPVIITVTDDCGEVAADTAYVTIHTDQEIELICPTDTTVFLCEPDTLCFPIGGIPEGAEVRVRGIASWWNAETQSVCFWSDCCLQNTLTVSVITACGVHNCEFTVAVQTNTPPLVLMPNDTSVVQCEFERICIPVGVSDIDGNFRDLTVSHGAYDAYRHELCFTPDSSGTYVIQVTATDSCNHSRTDELVVQVQLNSAPTVSIEDVDPAEYCDLPAGVCLAFAVADADDNIESITTSLGAVIDNKVCFAPTVFGDYHITITVTDTCGLSSTDVTSVTLSHNESWVEIACPSEALPAVPLCAPGEVCIPLPAITGVDYTLEVSAGATLVDNNICFTADTTGVYRINVTGISDCNTDVCTIEQPVIVYEQYAFDLCPSDTAVFLCAADTLEIAFSVIGGGHSLDQVTVNPPAWINGSTVFVPVLAEGVQTITLIADSYYCEDDTCRFAVTADFDADPTIVLGADVTLVECVIPQVCVKFTASDPDGNISSITASQGAIVGDSSVCFTAPTWGTHSIVVTVTDECGRTDKDTVVVTVTEGAHASIQCPDGTQFASLCGPGEVCVIAPVTPSNAVVTVLPNGYYNAATGKICTYVDQGGTHPITIIAASQCGADTCTFNLAVDLGIPPDISCPGAIDTLLCLARPDTLCFPVTVVGTGVSVTVSPVGYYAAGTVCVPISQPGNLTVKIKATGACGVDSCSVNISVAADQVPQLFLPQGLVFERCPDDTNHICIDGIYATDVESNVVIGKVCGPGTFTAIGGDSGTVCFLPTTFGQYVLCFEATDGCHTVIDTMMVSVILKDDCDVCLRLSVDGGSCTPVGLMHQVTLEIETNDEIGGFDLLMYFDQTALSFQTATMNGGAGGDWEYFTWNLNVAGSTGGLVRFVAIADRNNGSAHPPAAAYRPQGTLVFIQFLVTNDQNLGGMYIPVGFRWLDCTDNSFSDRTGAILYIDSRVFDSEGHLIWDEFNDVAYPESARINGVGAPDYCIVETGKTQPLRCIEFYNGAVCIIHPDSIDARGDINLNGIAYEIADAVVFTNYFIKGMAAFSINMAGQIAATDVNADGLTLTVADLTTLIRVIVGDANPIPKVTPYLETATVFAAVDDGVLRVSKETVGSVGAAYFIFDVGSGVSVGSPTVSAAAASLGCKYELADGRLKILLSDIGVGQVVAGRQDLFEMPVIGGGDVRLSHIEVVDYYGQPYQVASKALLPTEYALLQNYPNPFNPSTTISFAMPHAGDWMLRVFNINGALVREFSGRCDGGTVEVVWNGDNNEGARIASGVYFYRLDTSDFSDTRKMILLK